MKLNIKKIQDFLKKNKVISIIVVIVLIICFSYLAYKDKQTKSLECMELVDYYVNGVESYYYINGVYLDGNEKQFSNQEEAINYCLLKDINNYYGN